MARPVLSSTLLVLAAQLADQAEAAGQLWQRRYVLLGPDAGPQALAADLEAIGSRHGGQERFGDRKRRRDARRHGWGGPHWRYRAPEPVWTEPLPLYIIFQCLHERGYRPVTSIALRGDCYIITACDPAERPVKLILDARTGRLLAHVLGARRSLSD